MSSSKALTIQSKGIFHGLPTIPEPFKGLRAIVAGASGMSGQHMTQVLAQSPQRWEKVYAVSRSPPSVKAENIQHISIDLLSRPEDIATALRDHGVVADIVFFFSYVQLHPEPDEPVFGSADRLCEVNGRLLQNLLGALDLCSIVPQRILLQTGLKTYDVHLGPVSIPMVESDPRTNVEPNFYYTQEDILIEYCKTRMLKYNITHPSWILGAVQGSLMNIFYPLAVYASVQKYHKRPLLFPGDLIAWDKAQPISSGTLNSFFHEWLVLNPDAGNQSLNIWDGSDFTWGKFWPVLARWYGLDWEPPQSGTEYTEIEMPVTPRGYGPPGRVRYSFDLVDWATAPDVLRAWSVLSKEHNLHNNPFENVAELFAPLQFSCAISWSWTVSMDKARKLGWHGYVDSVESMRQAFETFAELRMIPPIPST
ncbi:hypothetical protein BP6252_02866 [Coleophoma cylindrospora]|uniref:PRISE-like Rossmann-fold domain-containing protein n=1 Tax=Coleophoma cylindrospora TaxID=1849047 RepID=A0A3D8SG55_9HELO|nr:hypothetical protein BP6252_02866 [Coleophoma cylindrospora]